MSIELKIPDVGESVREVEIGRWLKQEGDSVKQDEDLVELETDKASMELPAPADGVLSKILKQQGESVKVGDVVGYLDESSEDASEESPPAVKEESSDEIPSNEEPDDEEPNVTDDREEQDDPIATPSARRALREHGLEMSEVEYSGQRIERDDVLRHIEKQSSAESADDESEQDAPSKASSDQPAASKKPSEDAAGQDADNKRTGKGESEPDNAREESVPMSLIRRRIAERLVKAQQEAALLTTFNEIDLSAVQTLRTANQERFQAEHGVKLGYMSFFVKAVVVALKHTPGLNAEVRDEQIVYRNYCDICIAIGSDKGLVTPVLRDAEQLSFAEIELAIDDFAKRAAENKLSPQDLQGGTFTITNGGIYGSLLSTPIVNPPQSGVLGMHAIQDRPVVCGGEMVIRPMMYVALTYDHRIVDGREAVTFLKCVKDDIETPARMLLEV